MREYENLICSILTGEDVSWPDNPDFSEDDFYRVCSENGVATLIHYRLEKSGSSQGWPDTIIHKLQRYSMYSAVVEHLRFEELQRVLSSLKREEVIPILLKGAALSHTHYPAADLRERCDTDLFISVDAIESVRRIMLQGGYAIDYPFLKSHQFVCYKDDHIGSQHYFDIHWRISNKSRFARLLGYTEALSDSVSIPQVPDARVLHSKHALALACVHLHSSSINEKVKLIWLYDIHVLLTAMAKAEQVQFGEFAVARNIQDVCLQAIHQSKLKFHTVIEDEVEKILSTFSGRTSLLERYRLSNLGLYFDDLIILPGVVLKWKLLQEMVFPPANYLLNLYQKKSMGWYPVLLVWHVISGMAKRIVLR